MRIFLFLLLFLPVVSVQSQSTWNQIFSNGSRNEFGAALDFTIDGNILIAASRFDSVHNDLLYSEIPFYEIDEDSGILLARYKIDSLPRDGWDWQVTDITLLESGERLVSTRNRRLRDPVNTITPYAECSVFLLDPEFNLSWSVTEMSDRYFGLDYLFGNKVFLEGDSIVLFADAVFENSLNQPICVYFDMSSNFIGYEKLNLIALNSRAAYVITSSIKEENGYLCFAYGGNPTLLTSRAFIFKLNEHKQIVWSYEYPEEYDYFSIPQRDGLKRGANGDYAWVYKYPFRESTITYHTSFFVHDSNFVERWRYVVEDLLFAFRTVATCANGDYLVAGNDFTYERGDSTTFMPILRRFTWDGELLWQRAVLPPEGISPRTPARFLHLEELPDGRILGVGDAFERQPDGRQLQSTWTFALNANGCFMDDCSSENIITSTRETGTLIDFTKGAEILLFPNPAVDEVHLSQPLLAYETTLMKWSDAVGKTLEEMTVHWDGTGRAVVSLPKTTNSHFILQIQLPDGSIAGLKVERE